MLASTDSDNIISGEGNVLSLLSLQTTNTTLVMRDIHKTNEGYLLEAYSQKRESGAVYKACGIYGPYYRQADKDQYEFRAIFLQQNDAAFSWLFERKTFFLRQIYHTGPSGILYCLFPFVILGFIMHFFVLRPIKQLTKGSKSKAY